MQRTSPRRRLTSTLLLAGALLAGGCSDPVYDTSTPQAAVDSMQQMLEDERPDMLPTLLYIEPREIAFDDGVTEASAIEDVRSKLSDMLAQLWRVARKLQTKFPDEVLEEGNFAVVGFTDDGFGDWFGSVLSDPFALLEEQRERLVVEDMYDGTAAVLIDDEPAFGGFLSMIETDEGWRIALPVQYAQSSEFWPQTRYEWSVIASMMMAIENSLSDFEQEIDRNGFRSLAHASERAGRLLGESVVVQSVIYGMMKRGDEDE